MRQVKVNAIKPAFVFLQPMRQAAEYIDIHTHLGKKPSDAMLSVISLLVGEAIPQGDRILFSAGIHPWQLEKVDIDQAWEYVLQASVHPKFCAVGETGLDRSISAPWALQLEVFEQHIVFANQLKLPLIIHVVRALDLLFSFRKKYPAGSWIIHGFRGNSIQVRQCIRHQIHLSLGAALLDNNPQLHEAVKVIPDSFLFFETDIADISIQSVYQKAASLRNTTVTRLCKVIQQNYSNIFSTITDD